MIENLRKHVGALANTGVRVIVVFRKIPTDDKFCLLVETERLPDSYHDYIIQVANSREASETNDFYEVLNRRTFPDGMNCLTALHQRGHLRKEPITNVTMVPLPGKTVPLSLINATIDNKVAEYTAEQSVVAEKLLDTRTTEEKLAAAEAMVEQMQAAQTPEAVAKGLISQALALEADATAKREQAYAIHPESRPGPGRPTLPEDIKAEKLEERKIKRRERDQRNAVSARAEKKETVLNDKITAKLNRDSVRATPIKSKD